MRVSPVQAFTANNQSQGSFQLLTGESLAMVFDGAAGVMTIGLYYMADGTGGSDWVPVAFPDTNTVVSVAFTATTGGQRAIRGLPRGYYKMMTTAWTSGSKNACLIAY